MPISSGSAITLLASAARVVGANGAAVSVGSWRSALVLCDITVSATAAGDTLNVFIDVLGPDGATWLNAAHFTQQAGTGAARKEYLVLDRVAPGTAVIDATSDAAAGAVRPALFGSTLRARWAIVDAGGHAQSHTFSVTAYAL